MAGGRVGGGRATPNSARRLSAWLRVEVSLFLKNRFLAHEFYDEYYGHLMSRGQWDKLVLESEMMRMFRRTMFKRVIPNLKRIGLLSDRIRPKYAELGLLEYEHGKAAPELSAEDLVNDRM
ncbi:MAG: hypothetical protein IT380_28745 [Myxococcales bacterium]|nr:hypothetical protein [Myxococcales bacterium]